MLSDMERTIERTDTAYVVVDPTGTTVHLFDNVIDEIERVSIELVGRGVLPADTLDTPHVPPRGSMAAWDHLQNLLPQLQRVCAEQGESAMANLSPQLLGKEGWAVEVDDDGELRRFIVGRSAGWLPHHLEVTERNVRGTRARMEYTRVTKLYQSNKE